MQKTERQVEELPFLVNISGSIMKRPALQSGRLIKVSTYIEFALHMGHIFTAQTIYNRCKSKRLQHAKIDGAYFVLLDKPSFDGPYKQWANL